MHDEQLDREVRRLAFAYLQELVDLHGEVVPWQPLVDGFDFHGTRISITGRPGIFTPSILGGLPLSIRSAPKIEGRPQAYIDDYDEPADLLLYSYLLKDKARPTEEDRTHGHNVGLRRAMQLQVPLIYVYGVEEGQYIPHWPVYVVGDDEGHFKFRVRMMDKETAGPYAEDSERLTSDKAYSTVRVLQRLHQRSFSQKVLEAYRERCAICRLHRRAFLDAAHILPDKDPRSEPRVSHGLALCKLHHVAFDRDLLAIRPDLIVEIRRELLDEPDGPMLEHGLKGFHGTAIGVPRNAQLQPNKELLAARYELFQRAG